MIYLNGNPISATRFPDQTSQIWQLSDLALKGNYAYVTWSFSSEVEFMHLAQLKMLLDKYDIKTDLKITYLPYARQDKNVTNSTTFALYPFAQLLNSLHFNKIKILDPHSSIALDLINNSEAIYPIETLLKVKNLTKCDVFCYPDKGALNKYVNIYDFPYVYGEKVRNQLTGQIVDYKLIGDVKDKNVLLVDDLCDGGATFCMMADYLDSAGATEVNLFVTHGLFTKGLRPLKDHGIKKIFSNEGEAFGDIYEDIGFKKI